MRGQNCENCGGLKVDQNFDKVTKTMWNIKLSGILVFSFGKLRILGHHTEKRDKKMLKNGKNPCRVPE